MAKPSKRVEHRITDAEFERFAEEFKNESDRAAVVLGGAQLDLLLYQLLEAFLLPVTSGKDELLEGDSPLATFSARINVSYRLGLVDEDLARALHLVRKIRNSFAHEISSASLAAGAHRDRVRELVLPFAGNWALREMLDRCFDGEETAGAQFRACIAVMSLRLDGAIGRVVRVSRERAESLCPPNKEEESAPEQKE